MLTERTARAALEQDHREIDGQLSAFRAGLDAGEWRADPFTEGATALRRHIWIEETLLFPLLRTRGLLAPVTVMMREHGAIWTGLQTLERLLQDCRDLDGTKRACDDLFGVLAAHNQKEEVILYPAAQSTIAAEVDAAVQAALVSGTLPPDWLCEDAHTLCEDAHPERPGSASRARLAARRQSDDSSPACERRAQRPPGPVRLRSRPILGGVHHEYDWERA